MATVEEVRATLTADASQFKAAFAQAGATVQGFQSAANQTAPAVQRVTNVTSQLTTLAGGRSTKALSLLRGAMTSVVVEATAASGAAGRFATGLATLAGIGTGPLVALLAPLAGIAIGFRRAAAETKRFFDELQVGRERRQRELTAIGQADLTPAQARTGLAEAQAEFAEALRDMGTIQGVFGAVQFDATKLADAMAGRLGPAAQAAAQKVAAFQAVLAALNRELAETARLGAKAEKESFQAIARGSALAEQRIAATQKAQSLLQKGLIESERQAFLDAVRQDQEALQRSMKQALGKLKDVGTELNENMRQLGRDAVRSLVAGMFEGVDSFFNIVLGLFKSFLTSVITNAILPGAGIGKAAAAAKLPGGGTIAEIAPQLTSTLAPVGITVDFASYPPPRTPFDMARDAEVQVWLRQALTVASNGGFQL